MGTLHGNGDGGVRSTHRQGGNGRATNHGRLNDGSGKSHVVKACCDECGPKGKLIKFGQKGASTAGDPKKGESDRMKKKRKSFKARHRANIKKGRSSAAWWADSVKWGEKKNDKRVNWEQEL